MKKRTVHLVHGIHATRGGATAKLKPYFEAAGFNVEVHSYGWAWASTSALPGWTNYLNKRRAEKVARRVKDGDIIVCHSNGAAVTYLVQEPPERMLRAVILIQPALDKDIEFFNTRDVLVIYNIEDEVVGASAILPGNYWGSMGKEGYQGDLQNVEQWDSLHPPGGIIPYGGHLAWSDKKHLPLWGAAMAQWLTNKINKEVAS